MTEIEFGDGTWWNILHIDHKVSMQSINLYSWLIDWSSEIYQVMVTYVLNFYGINDFEGGNKE